MSGGAALLFSLKVAPGRPYTKVGPGPASKDVSGVTMVDQLALLGVRLTSALRFTKVKP